MTQNQYYILKRVCSIMGYICYRNFYNPDSEEVATILERSQRFVTTIQFGVICDYIPSAAFFMRKQLQEYKELLQNILNYSDKLASKHIEL